jgi:aspartate/glutamate racemase
MRAVVATLVFIALTVQVSPSGQSAQLPPASDMKTLGLVGGTSWYSTVDYYRYINQAVNDAYGDSTNPPYIGDATGIAIRNSRLKKVGLIGTLYTMEDGFMTDWLKQHYGIEALVPNSAPARQELHRIIQQELSRGIFKAESKKYVLQQIEELRQRGAQGIVLGCTEFPLIIKPANVGTPLFDTTLLHSQIAVDFILGKQTLAHVRTVQ